MLRPGLALSAAMLLVAGCARSPMSISPVPEKGDRIRYAFAGDSATLHVARAVRSGSDTVVIERLAPSVTGGPARWMRISLETASLARLEKRVARRGHAGRGALIGGGAGLVLGFFCASEEPGWLTPTPTQCILGYGIFGAGTGALIGALIRSDVWEPVVLPLRPHVAPGAPGVSAASIGIGIQVRRAAYRR